MIYFATDKIDPLIAKGILNRLVIETESPTARRALQRESFSISKWKMFPRA
jgi:hypothetical protein